MMTLGDFLSSGSRPSSLTGMIMEALMKETLDMLPTLGRMRKL
jgi:hypothetical protein